MHTPPEASQCRHVVLNASLPALAPSAAALRRAGGLALRLRLRLRRRLRSEPRLRERDLRRRLDDGLTAHIQYSGCTDCLFSLMLPEVKCQKVNVSMPSPCITHLQASTHDHIIRKKPHLTLCEDITKCTMHRCSSHVSDNGSHAVQQHTARCCSVCRPFFWLQTLGPQALEPQQLPPWLLPAPSPAPMLGCQYVNSLLLTYSHYSFPLHARDFRFGFFLICEDDNMGQERRRFVRHTSANC